MMSFRPQDAKYSRSQVASHLTYKLPNQPKGGPIPVLISTLFMLTKSPCKIEFSRTHLIVT